MLDPQKRLLTSSEFELIIYKNIDVVNNPHFTKQRYSLATSRRNIQMPVMLSEEMIPPIKKVSSVIQINNA